ncbi:ATP-dependent DNA helicase pif1-like [Temnothorax nylanderi]|uniref:ATP-dependent DNA helicase pif1-like n=1 Tax=Temnothorax nylanderi TaxID=102681 RepID=UPI003A88C02C
MSNPLELWNAYRTHLCDDILHRVRQKSKNSEVQFTEEIFNEGLILLEDIVFTHGEKCLKEFGLPEPQRNDSNIDNLLYLRETVHNIDDLQVYLQENEVKLNTEQKMVYDEIINSVEDHKGNIYFIDAPGGTGKTFVISLILAKVRSQKKIAIAVASSGIAATLLSGGRTAHSTFKLPLNVSLDQSSVCSVRKNGVTGKLLQQASLIVWDECTMSHKSHIDAVNRTLKDLRTSEKVMGGVTFVFTGDFRQTLPVVPKGTRADIMKVCMKKSEIWQHVKKLRLTINMRVHLRGDKNLEQFAEYLLKIGDGSISITQNGYINISDIVGTCVRTIDQIIDNVYPDIQNLTQKETNWLCERAIVTAKNKAAEEINEIVLQKVTTECKTYKSIDTMVNGDEVIHYPIEFLNSLNPAGLPPHKLRLKVGTPIMLLRNLKPPRLCNGTRLQVKRLMPYIIEATILTGPAAGEIALIPRIPMVPTDLPFAFKRLQFPVRMCFAMTINKSQGQTFKVVGVDLRNEVFSHGQLYVGLSRIGSTKDQTILIPDESNKTRNVVFTEVFND